MTLDISELEYSYNNKPVLDKIDFEVNKGEIIGVLGPNGCGKTTLLKNLNKNLSPKSGCVLLDSEDMSGMMKKDIAKKIAVVPQTNEISFAFTVREIVSMGRTPFQGMLSPESSEDINIVNDALKKTGLTDLAERYINTMSGGERQRVIIARAIAQTPNIILMDEPTLHLDISMQFDVLNLIKKLSRENNLTVVIVSHDLPMVAKYCDRIIMLHDHKIYAIGTPEEVLTPKNMEVVFNVDAELIKDERDNGFSVILHNSLNSTE